MSGSSERVVCDAVAVRTANTGANGWGINLDRQAHTLDGAAGQAVVVFQYKGAGLGSNAIPQSMWIHRGQAPTLDVGPVPYVETEPGANMSLTGAAIPQGHRVHSDEGKHSTIGTGDNGWISSSEGSRARTSAWPASGPVLGESAALSGLSSGASCPSCGPGGSSSRTSPDSSLAIRDATSPSYSGGWRNSGTMRRGRLWTHRTSESRSAAAACSLSQVLEAEVPSKYSLSARAAAGILRRAERRGRRIPDALFGALRAVAGDQWEPTSAEAAPTDTPS